VLERLIIAVQFCRLTRRYPERWLHGSYRLCDSGVLPKLAPLRHHSKVSRVSQLGATMSDEALGNGAPNQRASEPAAEKPKSPLSRLFELDPVAATDEQIQEVVDRHVASRPKQAGWLPRSTFLCSTTRRHLLVPRRIESIRHSAALTAQKPVLLVLNTPAGDIAAGYFVAKLCREYTQAAFHVAVPRRAKSAGTLICCGADRIHMGSLSELGPIDPQFGAIPALALKHSIEHIAELVGTHPSARELFSDYLARSLRVESLGFFE
jgi:hypothetical protein